jgi:hypothetical protein
MPSAQGRAGVLGRAVGLEVAHVLLNPDGRLLDNAFDSENVDTDTLCHVRGKAAIMFR